LEKKNPSLKTHFPTRKRKTGKDTAVNCEKELRRRLELTQIIDEIRNLNDGKKPAIAILHDIHYGKKPVIAILHEMDFMRAGSRDLPNFKPK